MTKPARGRVTYREMLEGHQKSMDLYAALSGRPRVELPTLAAMPTKRTRAPATPSAVPLEADVQRTIIDGLRRHPMVGLVERVNSGSAVESNADGSQRHIAFHRVYKVDGRSLAAPDVHCTLRPSGKRLVIEVKRCGWKGPRTDRELAQANYLAVVRECGGYGIFATSWDDVEAELRRIAACP